MYARFYNTRQIIRYNIRGLLYDFRINHVNNISKRYQDIFVIKPLLRKIEGKIDLKKVLNNRHANK